ncbi:InlB B-repeat-containing protein [Faecalibaculum rodentium]|uniref:InlB B-repeat-containing protein n=1 Tax=Faecalibaculum rodentium TaxID=1702221 RepID=UPI001F5A1FE7|nr:InlB B-repeat-containing protein [Faecalibaculum rodentium]
MKSKKNLAATLAFLMTLQATGQPWAVLASEGEDNEPIIDEAADGQTAGEMSDDAVIQEADEPAEAETPVTEAPDVQEAPAETPAEEEEETVPAFGEMEVSGEAPVQAATDTGRVLDTIRTIDLGEVTKERAPKTENAKFDRADVDGNGARISAIRRWNNDFYYMVENSDTVSKLEPGQTIILHYTDTTPAVEEDCIEDEKTAATEEEASKEDTSKSPAADEKEEEAPQTAYLYFYYYTEGSNVPVLKQQKVEHGNQTITLDQKEGYTLHYADEDGNKGAEAPAELPVDVQGDQEFHFVYVPGEANYTVKYIFPNGTVEQETKQGTVGTMTEVEAPEREGYTCLYYSNSIISPKGDTVVEVEYAAISYILNFDSAGGSFVNSKEFKVGDTVNLTEKPTREGYTFKRWVLGSETVTSISTANVPKGSTSVTVKAVWEAAEVNYTIRYWKQSVLDDVNAADANKTYDYVRTETARAKTGTVVKPQGGEADIGFRYNSVNSREQTVAADGSTVVDVKYDRIKCTVKFHYGSGTTRSYTDLFGAPFVDSEGSSLWDATRMWQTSSRGALLLTTYDFNTAGYGDEKEVDSRTGNWTLEFRTRSAFDRYSIAYYNEQYDGSFKLADQIKAGNNKFNVYEKYAGYDLYKYSKKESGNFSSADFWTNRQNASSITGEGQSLDIKRDGTTKVASTLKKYNIQYSSWNEIVKEISNVKYTTPLGEVSNYVAGAGDWDFTPDLPEGKGSYYRFDRWYLDPKFETPATDAVTMPNGNLILYAKLEADSFNVTLHPNNGGADIAYKTDVEGGSRIGEISETPKFEGHTFAGWYMDEACTIPFSADKTVEGDTHIYAKWTASDVLPVTIRYINAETNEPLQADEKIQARPDKTITVHAKNIENFSPEQEYVAYTVKGDKENVIEFRYHPLVQKYYKVVYVDADDNNRVVTHTGTISNKLKQEFTVKADTSILPEYYELVPGEPTVQVINSNDLSANEKEPTNVVFKVRRKKVQLTYDVNAAGLVSTYDGTTHVLPAGSTNLATGKVQYSTDGGRTWQDERPFAVDASTTTVQVKAVDTADNYADSDVIEVKLVVQPRKVTVTSARLEKQYDGTPLTNGENELTYTGSFADGEGLENIQFTGSQVEAGTYEKANTFTYEAKENTNLKKNYDLTVVFGDMVITKSDATIIPEAEGADLVANGISKVYDGKSVTVKGQLKVGDKVVDNSQLTYEVIAGEGSENLDTPNFTNVGQWTVRISSTNSSVNVEPVDVTVTILPRPITLSTATQSKEYDGTALTAPKVEVTEGRFVDGEGFTSTNTSSIIDAGSEINRFSYELNENTLPSNYAITKHEGTLTVIPRKVTVTSARLEKQYDGTPLTNGENELIYTGSFADGEGLENIKFTGSRVEAGTYEKANTFTYEAKANTNLEKNYDLTVVFGDMVITKSDATIIPEAEGADLVANGISKIYDGKSVTVKGQLKVGDKVIDDSQLTYEVIAAEGSDDVATPSFVNAGQWTVRISSTNSSVNVEPVDVTVTIEKRPYTVETASADKVYDGTPLTAAGIKVDNIVEGETFTAVATGTITNAGETDNTYTLDFNGTADEDNYRLEKATLGSLKVTQAEPSIDITPDGDMEITAEGFRKKYDGQATAVSASATLENGTAIDGNFTYTVKELATGETTTSKEVPAFTNSGKWEVTAETDNPNCKETSKTVTVEITKRNVLLVSEDQEWIYDGAEHRHEKVSVHESGDGFVAGEEPEFHTFASITDAGSKANEFQYRFNKRGGATTLSRVARFLGIASEDPDNIEANYNIEVQHGTLTVKKAAAENHKLALADRTVTYNGKDQTLEAASSDIKDAKVQYSVDGQTWTDELPAFKHVGKYTIYARAVHGNYEDAETSAVLEIVPAKLTVITDSAEKVYDGKPLTAGGRLEGLAEGDQVELVVTGSQTEVGESTNTCELKWTDAEAADYEVTEALGTLKVTPKPAEPEAPKKDETPKAPAKSETKKAAKTPTALGLDPALWTSIMGAAGLGMIGAAKLSRKDKKKKDEE